MFFKNKNIRIVIYAFLLSFSGTVFAMNQVRGAASRLAPAVRSLRRSFNTGVFEGAEALFEGGSQRVSAKAEIKPLSNAVLRSIENSIKQFGKPSEAQLARLRHAGLDVSDGIIVHQNPIQFPSTEGMIRTAVEDVAASIKKPDVVETPLLSAGTEAVNTQGVSRQKYDNLMQALKEAVAASVRISTPKKITTDVVGELERDTQQALRRFQLNLKKEQETTGRMISGIVGAGLGTAALTNLLYEGNKKKEKFEAELQKDSLVQASEPEYGTPEFEQMRNDQADEIANEKKLRQNQQIGEAYEVAKKSYHDEHDRYQGLKNELEKARWQGNLSPEEYIQLQKNVAQAEKQFLMIEQNFIKAVIANKFVRIAPSERKIRFMDQDYKMLGAGIDKAYFNQLSLPILSAF